MQCAKACSGGATPPPGNSQTSSLRKKVVALCVPQAQNTDALCAAVAYASEEVETQHGSSS